MKNKQITNSIEQGMGNVVHNPSVKETRNAYEQKSPSLSLCSLCEVFLEKNEE
jgi:hypothetical protein